MAQPERTAEDPAQPTQAWTTSAAVPVLRDLTGVTLGDFQVERLLGRGGMGEVYLARQISLNRPVAFKVLRPDLTANPTYLSRFEAEAWAVARMSHPNIVHVYNLGAIDNVRFIAMEYVQGTNLREYIVKKGPLDLPLALSIMRQAGQAIGAAGELGLVHRDIKPENLLMTKKGQVKVADFGLCRDLDQNAAHLHLTQPGTTMGTPMYMSPEQVQGHAVDHRSDLYSLGVTFYHMLTGLTPFRAETPVALALKHVRDQPASLRVHRPELSAELDALVLKLMAKKASDRYQSAAEMLKDLAKIRESYQHLTGSGSTTASISRTADVPTLADLDETPSAPRPAPTPAPAPSRGLADLSQSLGRLRPTGRGLWAAVSLALLAGLGVGWSRRAPDLLAANAPEPSAPPALWMAPGWTAIPARGSPDAQYRQAQTRASIDDLEAAWLSVPGRFPTMREWGTRAYTQLARLLFRRRDTDRLKALAAELARSDWRSNQLLAKLIGAGVYALGGDFTGVIHDLGDFEKSPDLVDPGMVELALELNQAAARAARGSGQMTTVLDGLQASQRRLVLYLLQLESRELPTIAPRTTTPE